MSLLNRAALQGDAPAAVMTAAQLAPADAPDTGAPWEGAAVAAQPAQPMAMPAVTPRSVTAPIAAPVEAAPVAQVPDQANARQVALSRVSATSLAGGAARMGEFAILSALENAVRVNWDTLSRIKATQGAFRNEDGIVFGEHIDIEVLSWQRLWQVSPGGDNNEATKKLVRYSDDGKIDNKHGQSIHEYLAELHRAGHSKATLTERAVLVFQLNGAEKYVSSNPKAPMIEAELGQLFQLNMPPSTVSNFTAHRIRQPLNLQQGRITPEQATQARLTAVVKNNNGNEYTVVTFGYVPAPAA